MCICRTVSQVPVVYAVVDVVVVLHYLGEQLAQKLIVGRLLEAKLPDVVQVDAEFLCLHTISMTHSCSRDGQHTDKEWGDGK